ncbi:MAG: hypothetical protein KDB21_03380, partial [Acidimicrobiales bacterium]|nr:hypothetical protein [Acidimicrobiales bacterium]
MGYLIVQMLALLILAVALGVLLGWLVFRWRRRVVSEDNWQRIENEREDLRATAAAAAAERDRVRSQHDLLVDERGRLTRRLADLAPAHESAGASASPAAPASPWAGEPSAAELQRLRDEAARVPVLEAELGR